MESVRRRRPVVAISPLDVSDGAQHMVSSCEDCACAVSGLSNDWNLPHTGAEGLKGIDHQEVVAAGEVVRFVVDDDHKILFHPGVSGGLLLVNESSLGLFDLLKRPTTILQTRQLWGGSQAEFDHVFSRLMSARLVTLLNVPSKVRSEEDTTLTAWLHVTNACNLRCPYCYVSKSAESMDAETGRAAVAAVFKSALAHGFRTVKLKYAGGEATLNYPLIENLQEFARNLSRLHDVDLQATVLSNGVHLPLGFMDFVKREGIGVMVSLDGIGDDHDNQRPLLGGQGSFKFVDRTIDRLLKSGVSPHLSITITKRNVGGVAAAVRYALCREMTFSLNLFRDNDCASSFSDLLFEEDEMAGCLEAAFKVIEEYLPAWSVLGSVLDRGQLVTPRERSCGVGQDYVVVDQAGRVAKCHMVIEKTLGDVFSDDPLELVRKDLTLLNLRAEEKEGCRSCTWKNWCSGGCSVATFRATGRFDVKSPNCGIYKRIYPQALRLEGLRLLKYGAQ